MTQSTNKHTNRSGETDSGAAFERFVKLIEVLRSPEGCPWDREQTHTTLIPNMLEEAYEAVDAIEKQDIDALKEELGDVLLQVVLNAEIARGDSNFNITDVIEGIHDKIVRRHPHVFGDEKIEDKEDRADASLAMWTRMKQKEKAAGMKGEVEVESGLFSDLAFSQSALLLATDISKKAVAQGFEWEDTAGVRQKLDEELRELEVTAPSSKEAEEEIGDVLFTAVNLARKYKVNPEVALRNTSRKFVARWAIMEREAKARGVGLDSLDIEELEELWQKAKLELGKEKGDTK